MNCLDELYKIILPISLNAGLLLMLAQRLSLLSKNYEFPIDIFKDIFNSFLQIAKPINQVLFYFNYIKLNGMLDYTL